VRKKGVKKERGAFCDPRKGEQKERKGRCGRFHQIIDHQLGEKERERRGVVKKGEKSQRLLSHIKKKKKKKKGGSRRKPAPSVLVAQKRKEKKRGRGNERGEERPPVVNSLEKKRRVKKKVSGESQILRAVDGR